nr:RibD C-terminal domain protein [uncultured bacterium]
MDGKMARNTAHLSNWTSPEDKKIFVAESKRTGVLIVGNSTFKTLLKPLPGRLHIVMTRMTADKTNIPGVVEYTSASPAEIAAGLAARGYSSAVLAGGSQINSLFLAQGMVDEVWLTVEPLVFGTGVHVFEGMSFDLRLRLLSLEQINKDAFIAKYSTRPAELLAGEGQSEYEDAAATLRGLDPQPAAVHLGDGAGDR